MWVTRSAPSRHVSGLALLLMRSTPPIWYFADRLETQDRTNRGLMYRFFGEIADPPDGTGFLPVVRDMLWARLRITPQETTRRFKLAARIRPRRSLTGPPVPPELPELADAVQAGTVGEDHIRAVCRAVDVLPA